MFHKIVSHWRWQKPCGRRYHSSRLKTKLSEIYYYAWDLSWWFPPNAIFGLWSEKWNQVRIRFQPQTCCKMRHWIPPLIDIGLSSQVALQACRCHWSLGILAKFLSEYWFWKKEKKRKNSLSFPIYYQNPITKAAMLIEYF